MSQGDERKGGSASKQALLRLAVFGDSFLSLVASFFLLVVAIVYLQWTNNSEPAQKHNNQGLQRPILPVRTEIVERDPPKIYEFTRGAEGSKLVSPEAMNAFVKDGVIAVRGLLAPELLEALDAASQELVEEQRIKDTNRARKRRGTQFYTVNFGPVFRQPDNNNKALPFREVALHSLVPRYATELLQTGPDETTRLMRDIFLAKDDDEYVCGWHVDDTGFWPAIGSAPGVNAWIAIDDMPPSGGGGFALAVGSHVNASWTRDAHRVIGSPLTMPEGGFRDAADMFANRTGYGTCNLKTAAPHLDRKMEQTKRIYNVQKGDVIFHTRWLFHRTVPFDRKLVRATTTEGEKLLLYRRYSVRYSPGWAPIQPGYGTELSVLSNHENGGRTADNVALLDGPWYPRCWPSVSEEEMAKMKELVEEKMPAAEELRKQRQQEMKPFRAQIGKKKSTKSEL